MGKSEGRENFEKELVKQGYELRWHGKTMYYQSTFSKERGPCKLSVDVYNIELPVKQWELQLYWCFRIDGLGTTLVPAAKPLCATGYNIYEFNSAQARVIDQAQRTFIPQIRKQLKFSKELSDLLEKK